MKEIKLIYGRKFQSKWELLKYFLFDWAESEFSTEAEETLVELSRIFNELRD